MCQSQKVEKTQNNDHAMQTYLLRFFFHLTYTVGRLLQEFSVSDRYRYCVLIFQKDFSARNENRNYTYYSPGTFSNRIPVSQCVFICCDCCFLSHRTRLIECRESANYHRDCVCDSFSSALVCCS